jgi:hypothetical protein
MIIISDLEGLNIHNYISENISFDKLVITGDIIDSTIIDKELENDKLFLEYKAHNIFNIAFICDNENVILILGNRDLVKIKIKLGFQLIINDDIEVRKLITDFNNGNIIINNLNYLKLKNYLNWAIKDNIINNSTFKERFDTVLGSVGSKNLLKTIPLELYKELYEDEDYCAFIVMALFNSMISNNYKKINYLDRMSKFTENNNVNIFGGLLYELFIRKKTYMIYAVMNQNKNIFLFSHGGITTYCYQFYSNQNYIKYLENIIQKNKGTLDINILENVIQKNKEKLNINISDVSDVFQEYNKEKFLVFLLQCNRTFKSKLKKILNINNIDYLSLDYIYTDYFYLLLSVTEINEKKINITMNDNKINSNYLSPIGPGFLYFVENDNFSINDYNIFQIFGHKPFGFSTSYYKKQNNIFICLDISNSFINTKLNNISQQSYTLLKINKKIYIKSHIYLNNDNFELHTILNENIFPEENKTKLYLSSGITLTKFEIYEELKNNIITKKYKDNLLIYHGLYNDNYIISLINKFNKTLLIINNDDLNLLINLLSPFQNKYIKYKLKYMLAKTKQLIQIH